MCHQNHVVVNKKQGNQMHFSPGAKRLKVPTIYYLVFFSKHISRAVILI